MADSPFHAGELAVQSMAGESLTAARNGTMIAGRIVGGALAFLAQHPLAVFSSHGVHGQRWASLLFGQPGFMHSEDGFTVDFDLSRASVQQGDPLWNNLQANAQIGLLLIDLATRRRFRINGTAVRTAPEHLRLQVQEAYPNCPQYITRRDVAVPSSAPTPAAPGSRGTSLVPPQRATLQRTGLLFLASAHPERGADASHRGGAPGFVQVLDGTTLRLPDYPGNGMFNTLGNLAIDARAGLVVPDFERGITLQLTGTAKALWHHEDPAGLTGGTRRFLDFSIERWLELPLPDGVALGTQPPMPSLAPR